MGIAGVAPRQHALDGIRAICAFGVLMHHHAPDITELSAPLFQRAFEFGNLAVSPFFVLSGYLITERYYGLRPGSTKAYLINRAARIFPLLILVTTVAFVAHWWNGAIAPSLLLPLYLANITTLKGYFDELIFTGIVQSWSLAPEVMFYALAPMFFLGIRRWGGAVIWMIPVLFLLLGAALVQVFGGHAPWGFMGSYHFFLAGTFFGRATEFAVGMAVAWFVGRVPVRRSLVTAVGATTTTLGFILITAKGWNYPYPMGVLSINFLWPILGLGPLLFGLVTERTWLRQALSIRPLTLMGRSAYAFYLIHLGVFYTAFLRLSDGFFPTLALLLITSWLLHVTVEEPIVRWAKRRWPVRMVRPSASPPRPS